MLKQLFALGKVNIGEYLPSRRWITIIVKYYEEILDSDHS